MRAWAVRIGVVVQLVAAADAHALDGHRRVTQYAQTHFAARDGMPHSFVSAIAQTTDGYLWTASQEGLARFDGARFTTFDHRKTEGVPSNTFMALAVDAAGTLWAGTRDRGVLHLVGGEFRAVAWEPGPQEQQIRALAFDTSGDLWVGMRDRGLVQLRGGTAVTALTTRDGLPSDDVRAFLAGRDGTMWIGTFHGLALWKDGRLVRGPAALDGVAVDAIARDAEGELWCATDRGLAHLRGGTVELVDDLRLPARDIHAVMFDRNGNLWIGTGAGVARMTPDGLIQRLPQPETMILALKEDAEGNVWIGSRKGLDRLLDGDVIPFGEAEGVTDELAEGIREDASGAMWITTVVGLFRIGPGETVATKVVADRGAMFAVYPDSRGDVWFGSGNGDIGRWSAGKFAWLGRQRWERIRTIVEAGDHLWFGTDHGMFRIRNDSARDRIDDAESVMSGVVVSKIAPDASGTLWLGTAGGGLTPWAHGSAAPAATPPGGPPRNLAATTVAFDPDGTMWVGTTGGGLWRLRDGGWFAFTIKDGMFDDVIWSVLDDRLGNLWMSSNRGIWRVSRDQLDARAAGRIAAIDSVVYSEADGMRDRECAGAIDPAGWRASDGRLWFPTGKGPVVIDPAHLHTTRPPAAVLESVRIDGASQRLPEELVLEPGSSRFELGYTAPALRSPDRMRFRYRLEGFDREWNDAGTERTAHYTNLASGSYVFLVQAGIDGAWGKAARLAVTLRPSFYQTGWFYVLAALSIALALVAVPLLRVRQLRARARELDRRVQDAVGELKVLSGLLPICAWCKKIRDDRGYWSRIEAYLSARTDAQFTHGICPDCTDKMLADESLRGSAAPSSRR